MSSVYTILTFHDPGIQYEPPIKYFLWVIRILVVVTPSLIFGAHVEHGVLFWDVVVTGCFKKIPPYQSFFLFRYGEDGSDLYAVFPQLSVDVISQECYGLVPVGNARLLPTELESHGC